jgi:nicotinamidase-related amidase
MQALIAVDVQNEFSSKGLRAVPNHAEALAAIEAHVTRARQNGNPIAWVQHFNKPHESRAFVPGTWGAGLSPGMGPRAGATNEKLFQKDVFGAFSGTSLEQWLRSQNVNTVLIVGFYAHMCLSTSAREAMVRGFDVFVDPEATGARDLEDDALGKQSADEVRRSALLHLAHMGVVLDRTAAPTPAATTTTAR